MHVHQAALFFLQEDRLFSRMLEEKNQIFIKNVYMCDIFIIITSCENKAARILEERGACGSMINVVCGLLEGMERKDGVME